MKERTKAYGAGIVDAEGCFSVNELVRPAKVQYQPLVSLSNTSLKLMKWLVSTFGGVYEKRFWRHKNGKVYKGYGWLIRDQKHIGRFLRTIYPYLVLKRAQADAMLEYVAMAGMWNHSERQRLFNNIRSLKRERVTTETLDRSALDEKTSKAYFAGFFDGEGSAIIRRTEDGYRPVASVGNTQKVVLDAMKRRFSGTVYPYKIDGGLAYSYQIGAREEIEIFLLALLPYLIVKREKSKLLLQFVRLRGECPEKRRELFRQSEELKIQSELVR